MPAHDHPDPRVTLDAAAPAPVPEGRPAKQKGRPGSTRPNRSAPV